MRDTHISRTKKYEGFGGRPPVGGMPGARAPSPLKSEAADSCIKVSIENGTKTNKYQNQIYCTQDLYTGADTEGDEGDAYPHQHIAFFARYKYRKDMSLSIQSKLVTSCLDQASACVTVPSDQVSWNYSVGGVTLHVSYSRL